MCTQTTAHPCIDLLMFGVVGYGLYCGPDRRACHKAQASVELHHQHCVHALSYAGTPRQLSPPELPSRLASRLGTVAGLCADPGT